jgi:hypothetical protein
MNIIQYIIQDKNISKKFKKVLKELNKKEIKSYYETIDDGGELADKNGELK